MVNDDPIGYRLSAIGYRLSAIGYRLSAISHRRLDARLAHHRAIGGGRATQRTRCDRHNRNGIPEHIEELDTIAWFESGHIVSLDNRADVARSKPLVRYIDQQNNVFVEREIHRLLRVNQGKR
jgi:hypothetical protein